MAIVWLTSSTGRGEDGVDGATLLDTSESFDVFLGLNFDQMTKVFTYSDTYNYQDTIRERDAYYVVKELYDSMGMPTEIPVDFQYLTDVYLNANGLPYNQLINALREGIKRIVDVYYDTSGYGIAPNYNTVQQFSYYDANAIEVTLQTLYDKIDRLSVVRRFSGTFKAGEAIAL